MGGLLKLLPSLVSGALPMVLLGVLGASIGSAAWDHWVDDPAVRRAAWADCEQRVARIAATAEAAERRRQQDAAREAAARIARAERERDAAEAELANQTEVQIARYREQLAALGRGGGCSLGPADLDFLRH